jgi:hypothetical protein
MEFGATNKASIAYGIRYLSTEAEVSLPFLLLALPNTTDSIRISMTAPCIHEK